MNMVVFAVHLDEMRIEVSADIPEDSAKPLDGIAIKHFTAIFRHKDQMYVHFKNAVSTSTNIIVFCHRPSMI